MKITKKREGNVWRVCFDGNPTPFTIAKGDAPRYREPQTYWVSQDVPDDQWPRAMFEDTSVAGCMSTIETIATVAKVEG